MVARRLTAFAAAGTIVLAACSGSGSADTASVDTETPPQQTTAPGTEPAPTVTTTGEPATASTPVDTPSTNPAASTTSPTASPAPTDAPVAVPQSLDFTARSLDGSEIELGQYAGRPVLLWFWAPW